MALTRKMLKAMEIDDEKIDQIIDAHTDVTDALKADRDKYKADAEKSYGLERELEEAHKEVDKAKKDAEAAGKDPYKEKYESEKQAFADYKKEVESERTKAKKTKAYKELLKEAGVPDKRMDAILRLTDLDKVELDDEGAVKEPEKAVEDIKKEWSEYIVTTEDKGAETENPPSGNGAGGGRPLSSAAQIVAARNQRVYGVPTKGEDQ